MGTRPRHHLQHTFGHQRGVARDGRWPGRARRDSPLRRSMGQSRAAQPGCSWPGGHRAEPEDHRCGSSGLCRAGETLHSSSSVASAQSGAKAPGSRSAREVRGPLPSSEPVTLW